MTSEWYTFWDDERATCKLEFFRGMAFVHLELHKRMEGMRATKRHFPDLLNFLRGLGYRMLHVIIPDGDAMLYRFERKFGFSEIKRHGGHILMSREC